jgi:hypothetical protein
MTLLTCVYTQLSYQTRLSAKMLHMCVYINNDGFHITAKNSNYQNYEWFNLTCLQKMDKGK